MAEKQEIKIVGRAVSRGTGIGKAVCMVGNKRQFFRRTITAPQAEFELDRYENALTIARDALNADVERARNAYGDSIADILESELYILDDPEFRIRIIDLITSELVNAEWAIQSAVDRYSLLLKQNSDRHLREKHLDIEDVGERLLAAMTSGPDEFRFEPGCVVAASELRASTILGLQDAGIAGIVTEHGGWTSHASILAREFEIPSVTGIDRLLSYVKDGSQIVVNGFTGEVVFDPSPETITRLRSRESTSIISETEGIDRDSIELTTLDSRPIIIRTNTGSIESYNLAKENGAKGIGLYRSEGLIGKFGRIPTEDEQAAEYRRIADAVGSHGVRIRTFDIDSDLYGIAAFGRQRNPALGLRAVRLGIRKPELLIPQIRALLRASFECNIKIVIPMVSGTFEIDTVRTILNEQKKALEDDGVPIGNPEIGSMIEIPSAALLADQVAAVSDFVCLGTNDLAQYLLAADRDNESVYEWFRTLHPAMLRLVKSVIDACRSAGKPLIVCGEMAGSPFYVPVLIGMGAVELSVGPRSIESVRRVISGIAFDEAAKLFRDLQQFSTADEVEHEVTTTARKKWPHLYPPGFFEQNMK